MIILAYVLLQKLLFTDISRNGSWILPLSDTYKNNSPLDADKYRNNLPNGSEKNQNSLREKKIRSLFEKYRSPLVGSEKDFLAIAADFNLDWRLLPAIVCLESGCGKYYTFNAFGWGNGNIECGSDLEDAKCVAKGIATLGAYARYRETGSLYYFARSYNGENWEDYLRKLSYFFDMLAHDN